MAELRRCIGSPKFGIEAHDAPVDDFPSQPSQRDGLGRMCRPHWNEYTSALRKAGLARKAAVAEEVTEGRCLSPSRPAAALKGTPVARRRRQAKTVAEVAPEPPTG